MKTTKTKTTKRKTDPWAERAAKIAAARAINAAKGTSVRQQRAAAKLAREKAVAKAAKASAKTTGKWAGDRQRRAAAKAAKAAATAAPVPQVHDTEAGAL